MSKFNYWKTQKGEVIKITEMSDKHLQNCIDFIEESLAIYQFRYKEEEKLWNEFYGVYGGVDINDYIPCPFDEPENTAKYKRLSECKEIMELELKSRK